MSAPTLPAGIKGISPFVSTRVHTCASPWACAGIGAGDQAAYVGVEGGLVVVCGECCSRIEGGESPFPAEQDGPEPATEAPQVEDGPMPSDPYLSELEPGSGPLTAEQLASGQPGEPLCPCNRGADRAGFRNVGTAEAQRWVHNTCGLPAYAGQPQPADPVGGPHMPDSTEPADPNDERPEGEGDDPADGEPETAGQLEHHECDCKRVTSRAKFGRTPDGRPTHEHCGGVLREKHRHLAPQPETEDENTESEAQTDDGDAPGDPAGTDAGAGAGTGEPTRSAHGAARPGEGRRVGGEGAGEGADGGDQGRGVPAGLSGDAGGDDPQSAHAAPVEGEPAGRVADRLEEAQGGPAAHVGGVREEDRELPARAGEVAGGLAAFFAQPLGDEPAHTLADFFAQPVEDDETWGAPVEAPDSDNYLGEFSIAELAAELGRRREVGGTVTALVVDVGELTPRIVAVPQ